MKLAIVSVLFLFCTGCAITDGYNTPGNFTIYKLDHRLKTVDGVQVYESEVVKVPYR